MNRKAKVTMYEYEIEQARKIMIGLVAKDQTLIEYPDVRIRVQQNIVTYCEEQLGLLSKNYLKEEIAAVKDNIKWHNQHIRLFKKQLKEKK